MIVIISGQIAAGKTCLADGLAERAEGQVVKVREALASILDVPLDDRIGMQVGGAQLDRRTNGRWLLEFVAEHAEHSPLTVVDSVRTVRQCRPLLEHVTDCSLVFLRAHESTRRYRYALAANSDPLKRSVPFDVAMNHPTEKQVASVAPLAQLIIETDELTSDEVVRETQRGLGLPH